MKKLINYSIWAFLILLISCNNQEKKTENIILPRPSVSIIHPTFGVIHLKKQFNGQIVYLNKTTITAPITGYVTVVNVKIGDFVKKGELLFSIQTVESKALQKGETELPSNTGLIPVYANTSGVINSLNVTDTGTFITFGNTMATIVKNTDIVVQANVPFEFSKQLIQSNQIEVELSDNTVLPVTFYKELPNVDQISQTQQILLKLNHYKALPENLNVTINFLEKGNKKSLILPKEALLTNETQDEYWIMVIKNDSLAVKVNVTKGNEDKDKVEILLPKLKLTDEIIQQGAYGLEDSTLVKITK